MQAKAGSTKASKLVMTAMMMCMIMVAIFLLRIPIPFTQGYVNLSDAIIFLGVMILGYRYGTAAAALGSMMGDIIGGFAMWAPWSFFIKGGMALIMGLILERREEHGSMTDRQYAVACTCAMVAGGLFMAGGYFLAEGVMYGNFIIAALGVPWNVGQFVLGIALTLVLRKALEKTPFSRYLHGSKGA